jgi:peroxiredoxin
MLGSASTASFQPVRLAPGATMAERVFTSITGESIKIPDPQRLVHLQFRRFAGCPVCSMHLRALAARREEIAAAGLHEVVFFYSAAGDIRAHYGDLPFTFVADPEKHRYREFGVHSAQRALLDPRAWWPIVQAVGLSAAAIMRGRPVPPLNPRGGRFGLPADFLIASNGCVIASKYGDHVNDQWSPDDLLRLAGSYQEALGPIGFAPAHAMC